MFDPQPGDRVSLPPHPPARTNGKPRPRQGTVQPPPFNFPGRVLVLEDGCDRPWWVPADILTPPEGQLRL
jgi:hypothetical protein